MKKKTLYDIFFPEGKDVRFKKTRWLILVLIQEISMFKWKAVFKYYYKKSYRKEINKLKSILSNGRLSSTKDVIQLSEIDFSHEINYPKWVEKLKKDLTEDHENYKPIKVFKIKDGRYIVVDGNHRLFALKWYWNGYKDKFVSVRLCYYPENKQDD
jgi:hypothetical protein